MTFQQWAEPLCKKSGKNVNVNGIGVSMGISLAKELKAHFM